MDLIFLTGSHQHDFYRFRYSDQDYGTGFWSRKITNAQVGMLTWKFKLNAIQPFGMGIDRINWSLWLRGKSFPAHSALTSQFGDWISHEAKKKSDAEKQQELEKELAEEEEHHENRERIERESSVPHIRFCPFVSDILQKQFRFQQFWNKIKKKGADRKAFPGFERKKNRIRTPASIRKRFREETEYSDESSSPARDSAFLRFLRLLDRSNTLNSKLIQKIWFEKRWKLRRGNWRSEILSSESSIWMPQTRIPWTLTSTLMMFINELMILVDYSPLEQVFGTFSTELIWILALAPFLRTTIFLSKIRRDRTDLSSGIDKNHVGVIPFKIWHRYLVPSSS